MLNYIIRRVLIFIPTLLCIALLTFILSSFAPGDPVENMLNLGSSEGMVVDKSASEKVYNKLSHKLGLDLPIFYFSLSALAVPDTLYKIREKNHRENLCRLINHYGNWIEIESYYHSIRDLENEVYLLPKIKENQTGVKKIKKKLFELFNTHKENEILKIINDLSDIIQKDSTLKSIDKAVINCNNGFKEVIEKSSIYKNYIPGIHFYGLNNRFHKWAVSFVQGDFGISYIDQRPVASKLKTPIIWSVLISILSIFFSFMIAIPLGIFSAVKKDRLSERIVTTALFVLYALPTFWIATMLIIYFCGIDYFKWFPAFGISSLPDNAPLTEKIPDIAYHLILPVFCVTYQGFAFIARQMRSSMLQTLKQDYIQTARAKGLTYKKVIGKHALRNSLIPIITMFANLFPHTISGAVVIEFIFSIPGMGRLSYNSLLSKDYPMVFTIVMLTAVLTLIGTLLSDILYVIIDPRISFTDAERK